MSPTETQPYTTTSRVRAFKEHSQWRCPPGDGVMLSYAAYHRKKEDITQEQICEDLGIRNANGELNNKVISSVETGQYDATPELVRELCKIYMVHESQITFKERLISNRMTDKSENKRTDPKHFVPSLGYWIKQRRADPEELAEWLAMTTDKLGMIINGDWTALPTQVQIMAEQLGVEPLDLLQAPEPDSEETDEDPNQEELSIISVEAFEDRLKMIESMCRQILLKVNK